jgi:glutamate synthase domain-containing protein 2
MLRLFVVLFVSFFTLNAFAQVPVSPGSVVKVSSLQAQEGGYSALEKQIIESSGLMSLSQQIKYTAQQFIEQSSTSDISNNSRTLTGNKDINHAQHFAIAKGLAKRWSEEQWQQRLLELVHGMPVATQEKIQQQLTHSLIRSAQSKEKKAIAIQHSSEYQQYINKLRQRPPAGSRKKLIENLDKSSGFSQTLIKTRAAVIKEISKQVKGWKASDGWQAKTQQEVIDFLFYAYRTTPNPELKRIAERYKQPELEAFYKAVRQAI